MDLTQKAAYIKGLIDGLKLDEKNDQNKVIKAMADLLQELTENVDELNVSTDEIFDELDALGDAFEDLENGNFDIPNDELCATCPACGYEFLIDDDQIENDSIVCPECGKKLEIDFGCKCGCGCDDCNCDKNDKAKD